MTATGKRKYSPAMTETPATNELQAPSEAAPPVTQAARIAAKFGGFKQLAIALKALGDPRLARAESTCYRWNLAPDKGGTGGTIPSGAMRAVLAAAGLAGVVLTAEDLDIRPARKVKP